MTCRRCLHLFARTDKVRVSTFADQLYDRTPRGAAVHEDRNVCIVNLRQYRNRPDVPRKKHNSKGGAV